MTAWQKPIITVYKLSDVKKKIKAHAWSVGSAMAMGSFLDSCNAGSTGTVYMEENPGHMIQVEVIGWTFIGIYTLVELLNRETGEVYRYSNASGSWVAY